MKFQKLENWTIFKFPVQKIIRLQNSSRYNNPLWEKYILNIPRISIYRTFHKKLFRSILSEIINFGPETQGLTDKDARKLSKS